jgi:hypothetical protein
MVSPPVQFPVGVTPVLRITYSSAPSTVRRSVQLVFNSLNLYFEEQFVATSSPKGSTLAGPMCGQNCAHYTIYFTASE